MAPSDSAVYASLRGVTKDILDTLTPREAKVLRMRFGIEMNTDHTLEECRQAVRRHARAYPPDRSESAAETAPSVAIRTAAQLPRYGELKKHAILPLTGEVTMEKGPGSPGAGPVPPL